jgi:hypothetical protein
MSTYSRHQFTTIDEFHAAVKANHHKQTFRYRLNIELGYYLVNTENKVFSYQPWNEQDVIWVKRNRNVIPLTNPIEIVHYNRDVALE